jgi:hypothetical protein
MHIALKHLPSPWIGGGFGRGWEPCLFPPIPTFPRRAGRGVYLPL